MALELRLNSNPVPKGGRVLHLRGRMFDIPFLPLRIEPVPPSFGDLYGASLAAAFNRSAGPSIAGTNLFDVVPEFKRLQERVEKIELALAAPAKPRD